jgi:acetyl-CoA carboxylase biotin carboxyl carrier protein
MNLKEIKDLIEIVSDKGFAEFEIERQGFRLRITRFNEAQPQGVHSAPQPNIAAASGATPTAVQKRATAEASESKAGASVKNDEVAAVDSENRQVIKSPIVGTFYRASSPESEPFVNVGDVVGPDTVVCIIEAMKLMNEIQAEVRGEVVDILVENGQPVEYGQSLFVLKV